MSSALVRQALELVDPDLSCRKRKKRGGKQRPSGQVAKVHNKRTKQNKIKKDNKTNKESKINKNNEKEVSPEIIKKLLQLSEPVLDKKSAAKFVKRAVSGKPLLEKIKVKKEKYKSVLFPEG